MASSVSLLNNYDPTVFTFGNKDLLMQGLMMKQGAYDINKQQLDQLRTQVAFLDIDDSKKQDVDYLNNRLKAMNDIIKTPYETGDLSNTFLVDQIRNKIEQVVDEPIFNMVLSKKTRDIENAQWREAMDRNDGTYSDTNRAVMSRNYQKWLNDGQVGSRYTGGGGFVEYVDVDKMVMSKEFNEYLQKSGINAKYIVKNGIGEFQALDEYEGTVDPNRLRQAIDAYIGEKGKKQLQINAIAQFGWGDSQEGVDALRSMYESRNNSILQTAEEKLSAINTYLAGNLTAEQRKYYEQQKTFIEDRITEVQSQDFANDVLGADGRIDENKFISTANRIYSANKMDALFNMTYMEPIWKDRKLDAVQAKVVEFNWDKQKWAAEYDLKLKNYNLNLAKEGLREDADGNLVPIATFEDLSLNPLNVMPGASKEITKEEAPDAYLLKDAGKEYRQAIDNVAKVATQSGLDSWNESDTAKLERYLIASDGLSVGDVVDLGNGRTFKITNENISEVRKLYDCVNNTSNSVARVSNRLNEYVFDNNNGKGSIDWEYVRNNPKDVPNIYFVKDETTGTYKAVSGVMPGAKTNNLAYIAYKLTKGNWDDLSDSEKMTANYYKAKISANSMKLSDTEKRLLQRKIYRDMGGNINSLKQAENKGTLYNTDLPIADFDKSVSEQDGGRYFSNDVSSSNLTRYGTEIKPNWDFDYSNAIAKTTKTAYEQVKSKELEEVRGLINRNKVTVIPKVSDNKSGGVIENVTYNRLRASADIPASYTGNIEVERVIKNGKPTDEFKVYVDAAAYDKADTGKTSSDATGKKELSVTFTEEKLRGMGVFIAAEQPTSYNVKLGDNAATMKIKPSANFYKPTVNNNQSKELSDNVRGTLDSYQKQLEYYGIKADVEDYVKKLDLTLSIQPIGSGVYGLVFNGDTVIKELGKTVSDKELDAYLISADVYIKEGIRAKLEQETRVSLR